ncbi:MAG: muconolactone Delta-isomerase family protein [Haloechinothrix sp.]
MEVSLPSDLDPQATRDLLAREKAYSQELQRQGTSGTSGGVPGAAAST